MDEEILNKMFPSMAGAQYTKLNLNSLVMESAAQGITKWKEPRVKQGIINAYHSKNKCISYGGWMEDRSFMWKGTYLDKDHRYIHLGVDINVNSGEEVHLPFKAKIIDVWQDTDDHLGWGKRVILEAAGVNSPYFILGHLAGAVWCEKGEIAEPGATLGYVGTWPQNGNVFEHIHLQAVERKHFEGTPDTNKIDGYGCIGDHTLQEKYPDPLEEIARILKK